jgi:hypothetical protein
MNNKLFIPNHSHSAGFFSNSGVRLRKIIDFYNKNLIFPEVDSSQQYFLYKDYDNDVVGKFFKTKDITANLNPTEYSKSKDADQFSDFSQVNYEFVSFFIDKYFSPSDEVLHMENMIIKKYGIDLKNTIAVCYRGNDKSTETNIPSYEDMEIKIQEVRNIYPNHKLLIQSDEIEFYYFIRERFDNLIFIDETVKINKSQTATQHKVPIGFRVVNAQIFLAVIQIISKCDKVITNSGNVGMWICLYRNNANGVYQYLNHNESSDRRIWINNDI